LSRRKHRIPADAPDRRRSQHGFVDAIAIALAWRLIGHCCPIKTKRDEVREEVKARLAQFQTDEGLRMRLEMLIGGGRK